MLCFGIPIEEYIAFRLLVFLFPEHHLGILNGNWLIKACPLIRGRVKTTLKPIWSVCIFHVVVDHLGIQSNLKTERFVCLRRQCEAINLAVQKAVTSKKSIPVTGGCVIDLGSISSTIFHADIDAVGRRFLAMVVAGCNNHNVIFVTWINRHQLFIAGLS